MQKLTIQNKSFFYPFLSINPMKSMSDDINFKGIKTVYAYRQLH